MHQKLRTVTNWTTYTTDNTSYNPHLVYHNWAQYAAAAADKDDDDDTPFNASECMLPVSISFILETQVRPAMQLYSTVHSAGAIQTQSLTWDLDKTLSEFVKER